MQEINRGITTKKKGKGKLPLFRGNGKWVIPIYGIFVVVIPIYGILVVAPRKVARAVDGSYPLYITTK